MYTKRGGGTKGMSRKMYWATRGAHKVDSDSENASVSQGT